MAAPPFLTLSSITARRGGRAALEGVSLSVGAGEFVALVGPSGAGKTTLLKSINRLVEPDEGTILLGGRDVRAGPAAELRRRIGYAFQGIGLFPHMDVAENIGIGPRISGAPRAPERVGALLDLVALPRDFASRMPGTLSGGQAQRVGLARALAGMVGPASHEASQGPTPLLETEERSGRLMLLDEPFGALDPVTRDELGRAYRGLHERLGLTTLMVTHDMGEALLLADRVVVLVGGKVRADLAPVALMAGTGDGEVDALVGVARRQAERLVSLGALRDAPSPGSVAPQDGRKKEIGSSAENNPKRRAPSPQPSPPRGEGDFGAGEEL